MSNRGLVIEERSRDIGGFLVGRLLPFRKKRMVGPFIFIDHMGPSTISPDNPFEIGPHPHIGLSTLTYLLEGEIMHRDSVGSVQRITPNEVNWMSAGRGIVHSERIPEDLKESTYKLHGYQIWVAHPEDMEDSDPLFAHFAENELPQWSENGLVKRLVAGAAEGRISPVPVLSKLYMIDARAENDSVWDLSTFEGEKAICVVSGSVSVDDEVFTNGSLLVAKPGEICSVNVSKETHLLLFGGEPFPEERHIWWNFVSSKKDKIESAKENWKEGRFPQIPGESNPIPLPE